MTRLQTDYVDEWRLHNVWGFEELDKCLAPDGALQAMIQAREEGLVRYISLSGHTDPQVQIEALRRFPFDTVLVAVSVLDHFIYSFAEEFLPVAAQKGVGVIGMKIFGEGQLVDQRKRCIQFAQDSGVLDAMTIGLDNPAQVDDLLHLVHQCPA